MAAAASSAVAINPVTGKPIKILTLEPALWRNAKTLVWFNAADAAALDPTAASAWSRWTCGAESLAAWEVLRNRGIRADVVLCLDSPSAAEAWFARGSWAEARLVVVPKTTIETITYEVFAKYRVTNVLCIDEIKDLYKFLGPAWDGTLEDAKTILALLLRSRTSFPLQPTETRADVAASYGLKAAPVRSAPPPLWVITQFYNPEKSRRRRELTTCLEQNLANPYVDKVILLNETACVPARLAGHSKLVEEIVGKRITYADVLRWIRLEAPANAIVAFVNADIFLDSSEAMRALWSIDIDSKFIALLRWDVEGAAAEQINAAKLFGPRPDSQDTWIVSAGSVQAMDVKDWTPFEFAFGKAGCDNAITYEMMRRRFMVCNPALTLRTYHYHTSQVRTYDPRDIVDRPFYVHLTPTGIHDMEPVYDVKGAAATTGTESVPSSKPILRPLRGPITEAQARTFSTMIKRVTSDEVILSPQGDNAWTAPPTTIYKMRNVFQTRDGLAFAYNSIFVGRNKASVEAWTKSEISSLSASMPVEEGVIAPCPDTVAKDPGRYVLEYLSKVLLLRKKAGLQGGEFWCSKAAGITPALRAFNWGAAEIPVLSRDDTAQAWCREAALLLHDDRPKDHCTREEMEALRGALGLGGWIEGVREEDRRVVVAVDGQWITDESAEELERELETRGLRCKIVWENATSLDTVLFSLKGAWGFIVGSKSSLVAWSWVLPREARVWEVQSEMEPSIRLLHMAGAADLRHRMVIVPKGAPTVTEIDGVRVRLRDDCLGELGQPVQAAEPAQPTQPAEQIQPDVPKLILPSSSRSDFFSHAGDSFRELARLWAEKGYVALEESPELTQVWLGGVGDTLLYDRPTLEWLAKAPKEEMRWREALFGNPLPASALGLPGVPAAKPWIFWPRRPRLVEDAVAAGIGAASYEDRARRVVFYGRSENAVQMQRRTTQDWSAAFTDSADEFVHVKGASEPYPLTQMEYLKRLAGARFGLCLAGYGRKCHREIECFAMGCVPLVAPEVDMSSYADPPLEGIHYVRVKTPDEAARVAKDTSAEIWAAMSAAGRDWWRRNASVAGSWKTTLSALAPSSQV
jgi:hypothetical protein